MRRGAWWQGGRSEGRKRSQARGAVPRGGWHGMPVVLLVDAMEDLTYGRRPLGRHFELAVARLHRGGRAGHGGSG